MKRSIFLWLGWSWLGLTGLGCATATPVEAPRPTLSIEPSSGPLVVGEEEQQVASKACRLTVDDFAASPQSWTLRLDDGLTDWGYLRPRGGGQASVWLEGEQPPAQRYRFAGDGMTLKGRVATDSVELFQRAPLWLEQIVVPRPQTALGWLRASGGKVTIALALGEEFAPREITATVGCDQLHLDDGAFDMGEALADADDDLSTWEIVGDEAIALYPEPQAASADLSLIGQGGEPVSAGEVRQGRRQVVIERDAFVVSAWVDASRLALPTALLGQGGGGFGFGTGRGRLERNRNRRDLTCPFRLPVTVEVADQGQEVGRLDPGRGLWVDDLQSASGPLRQIYIDDAPVRLAPGARWMAAVSDLDRCSSS